MKAGMNHQAEQYIRQNKKRRKVGRVVAALSVLVALITTYILMLPGITMEYNMLCGMKAHEHTDACYQALLMCGQEEQEGTCTETVTMTCSFLPHEHSDACYDSAGELVCGLSTKVYHTHSDVCYDGENLICQLDSLPVHEHTEECTKTEKQLVCQTAEGMGHVHTEECMAWIPAEEASCGLEETAGHVHTEECTASSLVCTLDETPGHIHDETCQNVENGESCIIPEGEGAHTHGADCFVTENICGRTEGEGAHCHDESCYPVVQTIICGKEEGEGAHTHTDACYTSSEKLVCTRLHQHESACYQTDESGRTYVVCGMEEIRRHQHSQECRIISVVSVEAHVHSDACYENVLICQQEEHIHTEECYPDSETVVTATPAPAETPAVTEEATEAPVPTATAVEQNSFCGIPEHSHDEACLDENGALTCGFDQEHVHDEWCLVNLSEVVLYCGAEEHSHVSVCYDDQGELVCGLAEHRHGMECLQEQEPMAYALQNPVAVQPRSSDDFGNYVDTVTIHTDGKYDDHYKPEYHPDGNYYSASIDINFTIPQDVIANTYNFIYQLPDTVGVVDESVYQTVYPIKNPSEQTVGSFQIARNSDGSHYLNIQFDPDAVVTATDCNGTLYFDCSIDGSTTQDDGSIRIEFEKDAEFVVGGNDIIRNEGETALYSVDVTKKGANNGIAFDSATNRLVYQVSVKTKGTPDVIQLTDTLNASGVTILSQNVTSVKLINNGSTTDVTGYTANYNNGSMDMTLPKVEHSSVPDGQEAEYVITYEVQLQDPGFGNVYMSANNSINAVSAPGTSNEVRDGDSTSENHNQQMLEKAGYYDSSTDRISWKITFNDAGKNIAGMKLTDDMMALAEQLSITPDSGYQPLYDSNNQFIGIEFTGDSNTSKYEISYQTCPLEDYPAWDYSETNRVTIQDSNDIPLISDEQTVSNIYRNQSVAKSLNSATENADQSKAELVWKVEIDIDANGLNSDLPVSDSVTPNELHYMTYTQLMALRDQLSPMLATDDAGKPAMKVHVVTFAEDGTASVVQMNIADINEAEHGNAVFGNFDFVLDADSEAIAPLRNTKLTISYTTTADIAGLTQNTYFNNNVSIGENNSKQSNATYEFVADVTNPVNKHCAHDGSHANSDACTWYHNGGQTPSWNINVYQNDGYDYIRLEDTLPADVQLTDLYLGDNLQTRLTYDENAQPDGDGFVSLTLNQQYDTAGLAITGRYQPATGKIIVLVQEDSDPNTSVTCQQLGKGKTLKARVNAKLKDTALPEPGQSGQYQLNNTVNVYVSQNGNDTLYDDDSFEFWYEKTAANLVRKMDMNWQENTSTLDRYNPDAFGWCVELMQDREYDELIVTDTLPEDLLLTKVTVGNTVITPVQNGDGTLSFSTAVNYAEEGLIITPSYDPATRQLTISIKRNPDCTDNNKMQNYGENSRMYVRYYFNIPEEMLPRTEGEQVQLSYTNTVDVNFMKDQVSYPDSDDQTQNLTLTYNSPVVKYNGDGNKNITNINNDTGRLNWLIKVDAPEECQYVTIVDQLPAGTIELDTSRQEGVIELIRYGGYWLKLGESTDGGKTYPLVMVYHYDQNQELTGYQASYNAETGVVTITLDRNIWNNVFGEQNRITVYCKVADEYMPNVQDGQYSKELGAVTNSVTVTTDQGQLGNDSQTQNVTVTQTRPDFKTVDKDSPAVEGGKLLHYQVDINPTQQDMDPAKNSITVVDQVTYSQSQPAIQKGKDTLYADRKLTLLPDTVKLFYADYDENGEPILVDGRLQIGEEVDASKWTMEYLEDDSNDNAIRRMTLDVPDGRALILVYDYQVSMNPLAEYRNTPLSVSNSVKVQGFENNADYSQTQNDDVWLESGGGGTTNGSPMTLVKHDASNQAFVLPGVQFQLEAYDADNGWTALRTLTTDENGKISITAPIKGPGHDNDEIRMNRLYRLVEISTITGYELPNPAPSYYFYWTDKNDTNGIAIPDGFDLSTVPNIWSAAQNLYVPNQKKATSLNVSKTWKNPDGSLMSDRDKPSSVTVDLHRYAIPEDDWNQLLQQTDGAIDGAPVNTGGDEAQVTIRIASSNYNHSKDAVTTITAYVGTTIEFDVCVSMYGVGNNGDRWDFQPTFDNLNHTSYWVENGMDWYHYEIPVTGDMDFSGYWKKTTSSEIWSNDSVSDYVTFHNIEAQRSGPADNSAFTSMLQPYVDRSYVQSMKLTSASGWKGLWENLDLEGEVVNSDGTVTKVHYKYYVTETPPSGYSSTITGYSSDDGGTFTVENRKDGSRTEKTNIRVYKKWFGSDDGEYVYSKDTGFWTDARGTVYAYTNGKWYTVDGDTRTEVTDQEQLSQMPLPSVSIRVLQKDLMAGENAPWINYIYNQNSATVINNGTNWMYNFTDLPTAMYNSDGQLVENYDYFIEEIMDGDFTVELVQSGTEKDASGREYEVITVKNAAIRDISIAVRKVWAEGSKPEGNPEVTVELSRMIYTENGYVTDGDFAAEAQQNNWPVQIVLNDGNEWTYQWDNLPNGAVAADGQPMKSYSYVVKEIQINGVDVENALYEVTYDHEGGRAPANGILTITNTKAIPKTEITAEKVWQDASGNTANAPEDTTVVLKLKRRAGENGAEEDVQEVYLSANNRWKTTVSDLTKFVPVDGVPSDIPYTYYFVEENVPEGYKVSYSNSEDGLTFTMPENGWVTVINRTANDLTLTKQWKDADGSDWIPEAGTTAHFSLMRRSSNGGEDVQVQTITLDGTETTPWSMVLENLPVHGDNGETYTYYFVENDVPDGFSVSYSNSTDGTTFTPIASGMITVTNNRHVELTVKKEWADPNDAAQSVQFELYQVKTPVGGIPDTLQAEDVTLRFEIVYYQSSYNHYVTLATTEQTFKSNESLVWMPSYSYESEDSWSVYYHPTGSDNRIVSSLGEKFTFIESASTTRPYTYVFDLGQVGSTGKTIRWITNNWFWGNGEGDNQNLWDDWTHQFVTSPVAGKEGLVGTYTLDASNDWSMTFTENDLILLDDDAYTYTYYVREVGQEGYTVVYDNNDGIQSGTITMTNSRGEVEIITTPTALNITKLWENAADCKPDSLTFKVQQADTVQKDETGAPTQVAEHIVTVDLTQNPPVAACETLSELEAVLTVVPAEDGTDSWTLTVANLPDTRTVNGSPTYDYAYTVSEEEIPGFTSQLTGDEQNGYVFTNTATELRVEKKWAGSAEPRTVQFNLWRRIAGSVQGELCANCQQTVSSANDHLAACGHYTCTAGFDSSAHQLCSGCSQYLCNGNDHSNCGQTEIRCGNCGNVVNSLHEHQAACGKENHYSCGDGMNHSTASCNTAGHYQCDGAQHDGCSLCNQGNVCQGNHGNGVCNVPVETVTINFVVENYYTDQYGNVQWNCFNESQTVPKGSTVNWTIEMDAENVLGGSVWNPTTDAVISYNGSTISGSPGRVNDHYTFTVSFVADQNGTATHVVSTYNEPWNKITATQKIETVAATASRSIAGGYTSRSSGAVSESVNTAGAEWVGSYALESGSWQKVIYGLPVAAPDGSNYEYFVEELDAGEYIVSYTNNGGVPPDGSTITITNSQESDNVQVTRTELLITKVWQNAADYKPDSLTFRIAQADALHPDGNGVPAQTAEHVVTVDLTGETPAAACDTLTALGATLTVTAAEDGSDSWTLKVDGLPDTRTVNGNAEYDYTYAVTEDAADGFSVQQTGDEQNGYVFTNSRTTTAVAVEKRWADNTPEVKPDVILTLYRTIGDGEDNAGEMVAIEGITNPVTLNGTETQPWHYTWVNLPAYGRMTVMENGAEIEQTGAYTYYVVETPVDGYTSVSTPENGIPDADGRIEFLNTPSVLNVQKVWEGYTAEEIGQYTVYLQIRDAQGNPVDPSRYGTGQSAVELNGQPFCFEVAYNEMVSFKGLPAGDYTVTEIAYRVSEGTPQVITDRNLLEWTITDGTVTMPADSTEEQAAAVTNAKRTQLKVEKVWGDGADRKTMEFRLWRREIGTTPGLVCPVCQEAISVENEHQAECNIPGHCYRTGDHGACVCGGYLCDGNDHTACGSASQDTVTISLEYYFGNGKDAPYQEICTLGPIVVQKGAAVEWVVHYQNDWCPPAAGQARFIYSGGSVTVTQDQPDQSKSNYVFTLQFQANSSGTIEWYGETNYQGKEGQWSSGEVSTFTSTNYSLRSSTASQTVNTDGATPLGTYSLEAANGWVHGFVGLPATSEDGSVQYEYLVEELNTDGYIVSYQNNDGVAPDGNVITICNDRPAVQTVQLTVQKTWLDESGNGMNPPNYAVHYELWAQGENAPVTTGVLNQANSWTAVHTGLSPDKAYYVVETAVMNGTTDLSALYEVTYQTGGGSPQNEASAAAVTGGGSLNIINRLKSSVTLPQTGGAGATLYTGAGVLLSSMALALLYKLNLRKRRSCS